MKRFVVQTALMSLAFALLYLSMVVMAAASWLIEHEGLYNFLYAYQVEKIHDSPDVHTAFIGDSSLGNAINAELFSELTGQQCLNLALNGSFGYAGSYNMIKKTHRRHPQLRNVVLMQTIDMQTRGVSFPGYARSITGLGDLLELSWRDQRIVLEDLLDLSDLQLASNYAYEDYLANDYIRQERNWNFEGKEVAIEQDRLNPNKVYFIHKIVRYCEENDLNLIYVHGPHFDKTLEISLPYITAANRQLAATGINLIEEITGVPNEELGDSEDHIVPSFKDVYTRKYRDLLAPWLR